MGKFRIEHDRGGCIMCGACAQACPKFWEMAKDGKSRFKGKSRTIDDKDLGCNKKAAKACPVNVIHITDLETGKRLF
jgi:ferredoxin